MAELICEKEKKFINYLKKWYTGKRSCFIKQELQIKKSVIEEESYDYVDRLFNGNMSSINESLWLEDIEDREIYSYIKNLSDEERYIVYRVFILGYPLTFTAQNLNISKQLAWFYKNKIIKEIRQLKK